MNIEYVTHKQIKPQSNYNALYTDDGKRSLFIQNFTVPDLTDILIESVESVTDTWYAMVDELRRRIARRMANSVHYSQSNAYNLQKVKHPTTCITNPGSQIEPRIPFDNYDSISNSSVLQLFLNPEFINLINSNPQLGFQMWKRLPHPLKMQLSRNTIINLSQDSGGNSNHNDKDLSTNPKPNDVERHNSFSL